MKRWFAVSFLARTITLLCLAISMHSIAAPQFDMHDRTCHYLPQFKALYKRLANMTPVDALEALQQYSTNPANDNSDNICEAVEVERLMTEREIKLVYLTDGSHNMYAQLSMHCDGLIDKTMQCNSISEDVTALPLEAGITPKSLSYGQTIKVVKFDLPGAKLFGAYSTKLNELRDGKPVRVISSDQGKLNLHDFQSGDVLMVILKGPKPWIYRKFVWYF